MEVENDVTSSSDFLFSREGLSSAYFVVIIVFQEERITKPKDRIKRLKKKHQKTSFYFPASMRKKSKWQNSDIWIIHNAAVVNNSHEQIRECDVLLMF